MTTNAAPHNAPHHTPASHSNPAAQAMLPALPALRDVRDADHELLLSLYRFTHVAMHDVLANISIDAAQTLLQLQVRAQAAGYRQRFPESIFQVICAPDGQVAGRLTTARTATYLHLLDIGLFPAYCGQGWGTYFITSLQCEAGAANIPLHLAVARSNRALNLYRRLGFTITTQHDLDLGMTWFPPDKSRSPHLSINLHKEVPNA
ncbi:MAG: GNAT family N-acetyltransferase [Betaproteobacteria bacterium]